VNLKPTRTLFIAGAIFIASTYGSPARQAQRRQVSQKHTQSAAAKEDPLRPLFKVQQFEQVAISPDGKKVAWVEIQKDQTGASTGKNDIYVQDLASEAKPQRVTAGGGERHFQERAIAWSPDGKNLAFLSDSAKPGQLQLYIVSAEGSAARQLTHVKGLLATPRWSPDGKSIAVLYTANATREAGPLMAETAETGLIKDAFFEQRLALVPASGGELRSITPDDMYIYEYDWAPDSKTLVMTAARGNGDNNWWIAELYTLSAVTKEMHSIYKPKLQIARPGVSPDGARIAFIEGLMSDEDSVGGDVFTIPIGGGAPLRLTSRRKASASVLAWASDGKLIDMENADAESSMVRIDPSSGSVEQLYHAPELLTSGYWSTSISLTPNGAASACVRSSFSAPPEVWAGPIGNWRQLTHRNAGLKPAWGEAKSIHWRNDGLDLQGWLIYPKDFDASKKYPMIVSVHGGPGYAIQASWPGLPFDNVMALPGKGYFLFQPNPRGSFGEGEEFTQANVKDFGYGDWRDVLSGVDAVLASAGVDPQRLGLTGWSYGGYMTMWGVTQTNRFRAAVAGAGIADWASYYGENQIDQWMIPFFGKSVYDDPQVYARSAPLTYIKNVKTPTLIVVGDSDGECPTPQSYEFWHALKTLGVETELVVYEHEGHMFVKPAHVRDVIDRMTNWFDTHLQ
jgi:dipeptidyl aminopeptidase/acylaminoacyl peptidase